MPQVNPKKEHRIYYPNFAGGMNLSVPPEALEKNELSDAVNVEYSAKTGAMTVRDGLSYLCSLNEKISSVAPLYGANAVLVITFDLTKYRYYVLDFRASVGIFPIGGMPTGSDYTDYGVQAVAFDENTYILTNGAPFIIPYLTHGDVGSDWVLNEVRTEDDPIDTYNPKAIHMPFVRSGRVGFAVGDYLNFSAVGTFTDWNKNTTSNSGSKYIEIGYKDGLDISAVVPLSKDIVIFKKSRYNASEGKIYRLANNYPDWEVSEIASGVTTYTSKSVCVVGNDVYFLSPQGLQTLSTVQAYGDVKANWPDQKINQQLISEITYNAQMWNIPSRQQLWISPSPSCKHIWIFDYVHMIWTKFDFLDYVSYACELNGTIYVFMGKNIFTLDKNKVRDDTSETGRADIEASMKCGKLTYGEQILIKGAYAEHSLINGYHSGELDLDAFSMPFTTQKTSSRRRCIVRGWSVTPEIKMKGGGTSISSMGLDTAEI
ncbi:MAG: hypothetical protein IJQ08_00845 [Synergistaceae bacterium]|nr:hypothetical protein [Synergistaceae bacterium]